MPTVETKEAHGSRPFCTKYNQTRKKQTSKYLEDIQENISTSISSFYSDRISPCIPGWS